MRRTTSSAVPRMSMGYPPLRSAAAFSTTVTSKPYRPSQKARAGPAMLAPEIRTVPLVELLISAPPSRTPGRTTI
ncbi:hypothetical protein NDW01_21635 [Actinoallomurus sp. WRP6H-15]|nr:hypothetical protein [Actinoallomurus soli]MCO5971007.1 hypothetical protein [Actinoallomurus soli]